MRMILVLNPPEKDLAMSCDDVIHWIGLNPTNPTYFRMLILGKRALEDIQKSSFNATNATIIGDSNRSHSRLGTSTCTYLMCGGIFFEGVMLSIRGLCKTLAQQFSYEPLDIETSNLNF